MAEYKYQYLITFNGEKYADLFCGDSEVIKEGLLCIRRLEDEEGLHEAYFIPISSIKYWSKKLDNEA